MDVDVHRVEIKSRWERQSGTTSGGGSIKQKVYSTKRRILWWTYIVYKNNGKCPGMNVRVEAANGDV